MQRREFITLLGGAAAWPFAARAQSPALPVIGYLSTRSFDAEAPLRVPFLETLDSGFSVGRNIAIEYRYADGREARLPVLAAELVARNVAVLVAFGRGTALAAKAATSTIPIVFARGFDPVLDGPGQQFTLNPHGLLILRLRFTGQVRYGWNAFPIDAFDTPSIFATTRNLIASNRELVMNVTLIPTNASSSRARTPTFQPLRANVAFSASSPVTVRCASTTPESAL